MRIERIELALRRVNEPNNIDAGLFIPAWSCYGSIKNEYKDGHIYDSTERSERIVPNLILTINALDGSIINTEKGY